jgi:murein DD-endopeptidase MepM/ murein hydrolase activator NlpD
MRTLLVVAALVLALGAGGASGATFTVLPDEPQAPAFLPGAETPNEAGALLLPPGAFAAQFLPGEALSYGDLHALWLRAGATYGIPWQVLAAINKIESNFGRNMGPSSAGAVGWMQFMPDTWLRWGVDASGDGIADPWNAADAVHAAARYLAAAGGQTDIARGIFAYNHAQWYVDEVLQLAALFGGGGGADVVFSLDRMAVALEEAEARVASLGEELRAAEDHLQELQARAELIRNEAGDLSLLLSDRLDAEREAFAAEQERDAAAAEVARLQSELDAAETDRAAARSGAHSASFVPAAAGLLRMPTRADGYVFPVGGGPAAVSVGHTHHDYPAADIAAPLGSPVYALADAVVQSLVDDDRCGIGLRLRSLDGLDWIYCHLSYRDQALQPGAMLAAGEWVGLVGSTGNSTGPHLHLGLDPARYPQEMPWFQEFAGDAFTWQDGVTSEPVNGPIFAVVAPSTAPSDDVVEFTLPGS